MRSVFATLAMLWLALPAAADVDAVTSADRLLLADALYGRGMYEQARREYAALAAEPGMAGREMVLFRLAESCRRLKRNADAETSYARLVAEFPHGACLLPAQLQRAALATEAGRFAEAVDILTPLAADAALAPDIAPALLQALAEALEGGGNVSAAIGRYAELRRRFPDSDFAAPAAIREAYALSQAGRRGEAIEVLREAARLARSERVAAEALFQLGQTFVADGRPREAAGAFAELRQKHPADPRTRVAAPAAAWACHDAQDYAAAVSWIPAGNGTAAERADFLYVRADSERRRGRLAEAAEAYRTLIAEYPQSPRLARAHYEYLLTLFEAGRHADLLAEAEKARPQEAWAADVLWMRAESSAALQRNDAAIELYRAVAQKYPKAPFAADALVRAGWLLQAKQAWLEAAGVFSAAAENYPGHPQAAQALYAAGVCYSRAGDSRAALARWEALEAGYRDFKEADEALFLGGLEMLRLKDDAAAIAAFGRLMTAYPQTKRFAEACYWRGVLRRQAGDTAGAAADFRATLQRTATAEIMAESRLALGALLLQQGEQLEAAGILQPLLEEATRGVLPCDRLAWLAEFQYDRGALAEAATAARALAERGVDAAWTQTGWTLLGRAQRAQKKPAEAAASYARAIAEKAVTRYLPEALLRLGEILIDDGKFAEAEARLREAVAITAAPELQQMRAHAYAELGRCAEARGQNEEALRYYLSVALLYDDATLVPMALDKAANLHAALGRAGEGEAVARELVGRYPASPQAKAWQARFAERDGAAGRGP